MPHSSDAGRALGDVRARGAGAGRGGAHAARPVRPRPRVPGHAPAFHTFSSADVDDEFSLAGTARVAEGDGVRGPVYEAYVATGAFTETDTLFELLIERALHAKYEARPSWPPVYTKWRAQRADVSG